MAPVTITNTSNPKEPRPEMYTIPFKHELVELILKGEKVKTYRYGKKYDYLKIGDKVKIQSSKTHEMPCEAIITDKLTTTFKNLPLSTSGHESYNDKEKQRQKFSEYYSYIGREVQDDDPFLIFEFQLININPNLGQP